MRVGFLGLGKLGLPVATAMAARGIEVYGYDPVVRGYPDDLSHEDDFAETVKVAEGRVHFCDDMEEVVRCPVVFVAVPTPHQPEFEGITPLPLERADFDYSYLRHAVGDLARLAAARKLSPTVAVISTVLPGTMKREVEPLLGPLPLVYNPSFIAMGTTIRDFLDPEFVLIGGDDGKVADVYEMVGILPYDIRRTTVPNAELIKVAYNTFIGLKLAFANTLGEVCHKTDCDVDEVTGALKLATRRLISPAYMDAGMGDGGGCHPRDQIALSWLARELDLSYDIFEAAMLQRERHAEWLADLLVEQAGKHGLPIGILGIAYKPGSHITTGSPALLVKDILERRGYAVTTHDPYVGSIDLLVDPRVWLVGCKHPQTASVPQGSIVIDPWRYYPDCSGVEVIRLGERVVPDDGETRASRELPARAA